LAPCRGMGPVRWTGGAMRDARCAAGPARLVSALL
jgi:hypothetical protein